MSIDKQKKRAPALRCARLGDWWRAIQEWWHYRQMLKAAMNNRYFTARLHANRLRELNPALYGPPANTADLPTLAQFVDYFPKPGEICEYQRSVGLWIPCEIIRGERREPTLFLARYVSHTGQLKTGLVGPCNLRPSPQNAVVSQPRGQTPE